MSSHRISSNSAYMDAPPLQRLDQIRQPALLLQFDDNRSPTLQSLQSLISQAILRQHPPYSPFQYLTSTPFLY